MRYHSMCTARLQQMLTTWLCASSPLRQYSGGKTALLQSAQGGNSDCVEFLLSRGADISRITLVRPVNK